MGAQKVHVRQATGFLRPYRLCEFSGVEPGKASENLPFVLAGVLRSKFTIHWNKDRGTNPDGSERHNDQRLTGAEKETARAPTR
jgi:hypothetical protein